MTDTHTTAHILDEAVRAAEAQFTEYFLKNYPKDCIIYNPAWHAPKIFRAAKAAITENLPQHLSAPCAVEVDKLHWDGLVGFVGSFSYVVAPPSFTKGWRVWGKLSDKSASVGGVLITTTAADEEEAKSAAQADFERRILSCVATKPVDVAAVREECAEVVENAVLSYHVADCAGLADWKAFEKGQESGLKFGAAAIRALSAEPAQGDQWQPIETAPKGFPSEDAGCRGVSEWFMARPSKKYRKIGASPIVVIRRRAWPHEDSWMDNGETHYVPDYFEGWMPLPAAPTPEAGK